MKCAFPTFCAFVHHSVLVPPSVPKFCACPATKHRKSSNSALRAEHQHLKTVFLWFLTDTQPPRVDSCISPPPFILKKGRRAAVTWDEPVFTDNSRGALTVHRTHKDVQKFPIGATMVKYTATDKFGNNATCSIKVTVKGKMQQKTFLSCFWNESFLHFQEKKPLLSKFLVSHFQSTLVPIHQYQRTENFTAKLRSLEFDVTCRVHLATGLLSSLLRCTNASSTPAFGSRRRNTRGQIAQVLRFLSVCHSCDEIQNELRPQCCYHVALTMAELVFI